MPVIFSAVGRVENPPPSISNPVVTAAQTGLAAVLLVLTTSTKLVGR